MVLWLRKAGQSAASKWSRRQCPRSSARSWRPISRTSAISARRASCASPGAGFAILTCMDARLDPAKYAGLAEGDAHVIRNAGGRATDDAIRSLIISHKLLGTKEWFVIHHTNCGMELFSDEIIADLLEDDLSTASFDGKKWANPHHKGGHAAGHFIKWHTIKDQQASVVHDVKRIRAHPLVPRDVPVYGYIYDVKTGRLNEVKAATEAGKAAAAAA